MVRVTKSICVSGVFDQEPKYYRELSGLSTDTKPTNSLITGCLFLEVDTGDVYAYDEVAPAWNKIASLGGGN